MTQITPDIVAEHGLSPDEYQRVLDILGREPNLTELGIFSVMWSEHCSYKSSRLHLKKLPTTGPQVICGPGENAGVVDIGDGLAAVFKMESHNHPSYIEPYQGAATGVGGILRDVFTMGARPIAILDPLRFGSPEHPKTRHLVSGVVAGIGGYGNCMGIPNVGGECTFHRAYDGNILVNAMTVGIAQQDKIFYSAAAGIGNPVVYVGSKTGRDGIHGATMASAEFDEKSEEKRPTVQVGDPFVEKLLLEACLELMAGDAIVAIQDMGAAGLTSSSVEMASKGGVGIELVMDDVPQRELGMTAYEMMLSESQERMLMILKPGREDDARAIFEKWGLAFAVIGRVTDTGHLVLRHKGEVVGDIPVGPLTDQSPLYDRPWEPTPKRAAIAAADVAGTDDLGATLAALLGTPDLCSKRWIIEQYDHLVGGDTVVRPGGDAAVVRVRDTKTKGLAITTDCTPRYCFADPVEGGKQAVVETYRNITAVGGLPLAITDCMNFGNPQRPNIMGQFVGAIEGMADACRALDYPVVSGNVSLYNETMGTGVQPTPAIGGIGLLDDYTRSASIRFKAAAESILLVGDTAGWLGSSIYLREVAGSEDGAPPPVDLAVEKRNGDFVRGLIRHGEVVTCHDVADGGLLVAIAEMALAGGIGATLATPETDVPLHGYWFGEDQGRYLAAVPQDRVEAILDQARDAGVPVAVIGTTGGDAINVDGKHKATLAALKAAHEGWLPAYMAA
ncbi:phosphoribosylformylglycinamidine synthase subunit PurL [Zavarzinia compransoris]|uniref:Phosphoribosylformylglycinamidine synthase subunit PurL n=1 Tax=Zavarzinia compransoris TaxID=1264899 RepID=A0A317EE39_9PROT|nr:phosphoribosylformylglycinamidine synthase subunit PurL [Zavarzinia compransoris]PWR23613.1 phosphoribosylformylglycinamidine synthase subunit PurL [Zavarzinia compransoris]TDP47831.1 phosphoribosylformylglycinamidine synthase subunit II [Zavarzinia compransoris]